MNRAVRGLCRAVMWLNLVPRYGRLYRWEGGQTWSPPQWRWQRHGHWGVNLLDRADLLWPYLDTLGHDDDLEQERA